MQHFIRRTVRGRLTIAPRALRRGLTKRAGATLVEFAMVAPIFFLFVFGIIEFGRMVMVQQILTNASREGARQAVVEGATEADVKQFVSDFLTNSTVSGADATVSVTPTDLTNLGFGDTARVSVSIPFQSVSWIPAPWFLANTTLKAGTVMRGERLQ